MAAITVDIGVPTHYHLGPVPGFIFRRTSPIVYSKRLPSEGSAGQNLLAALTTARDRLAAILDRPPGDNCMTVLPAAVNTYLSLLRGLMSSTLGDRTTFDSPLRPKAGKVLWTSWTDGTTGAGVDDTVLEGASVLVGGAVCLNAYAAIQAQRSADDEASKNAFRALSLALTWVTFVRDEMVPQLNGEIPVDMRQSSIQFLHSVLSAHAHEIIVGRAEGQGHDSVLINKLARYTSEQYALAAGRIPPMEGKTGAKISRAWTMYFDYKANFFQAVAYHRHALVLASDKGKRPDMGPAVKASDMALQHLERALASAAAYTKETKMADPLPQQLTTGRRLRKDTDTIKRTNSLVQRAKVPPEPPLMPDSQSTMPVTSFVMPAPADLCTEAAMQDLIRAIDISAPSPAAGGAAAQK